MKTERLVTKLSSGSHKSIEEGMCIMEAVAYIAGEPHSDHPVCACPVLTSFMIKINDSMREDERQQLRPYVERLVGTRDGLSAKRVEILVHLAVAEVAPHALRLTALPELIKHAEILEALKPGDYPAAYSASYLAADSARSAYLAHSARSARLAYLAADSAYLAADSADLAARSARLAYLAADSAYLAARSARSAHSAADSAYLAARSADLAASERQKVWDMVLKALDRCLELKS